MGKALKRSVKTVDGHNSKRPGASGALQMGFTGTDAASVGRNTPR
jgi:hypothetical protein